MSKSILDYFNNNSSNNKLVIKTNIISNENKKTINIYTDGACINNGKKNAKAGIGIYIPDIVNISERIIGHQTNQRAELYAILKSLKFIKINDYNLINIYSDSQYSINCLTKWIYSWLNNNWLDKKKKPVKNKDIIEQIYNIIKNYNFIKFHHVYSHTNKTDIHSIGNDYADKLARESLN